MRPIIETSAGATITVAIQTELTSIVSADLNQFETALLNLVINARDAMPAGGKLAVSSGVVDGLPSVRGHAAATGKFVSIRVEDSGSGIAPETLSHIFEPFFTTKGLNKGTGLGLSQIHGFAKQSGGEIDVASRIGSGTSFTLYLPIAREEQIAAAAPARRQRQLSLATKRVLLVEDNEAVGQFARGLFEELGQIVTWAQNAEDAIEMLDAAPDKFDLVFTDVVMPGMNGVELAHAIEQRWPDLRVVLTSDYSHVLAEDRDHGLALLRKPYSVEGILGILDGGKPPAA